METYLSGGGAVAIGLRTRQHSTSTSAWKVYGEGLSRHARQVLAEGPDALLARAEHLPQSRDFRYLAKTTLERRPVVLKTYLEGNGLRTLRTLFRRSKAEVVYRATRPLIDLGVRTPRPVAHLSSRFDPLVGTKSCYVYEYVEGSTLEKLLCEQRVTDRLRQSLFQQALELFQKMASAGYVLPDPRARNFIVDAAERLWVIDLDRLHRPLTRRGLRRLHWHSFHFFLAEFHWPFHEAGSLADCFDAVPRCRGL